MPVLLNHTIDNGVSLDFAADHGPVHPKHYAFLVDESEFDEISGHLDERRLAAGLTPFAEYAQLMGQSEDGNA